MFLTTPQVEPRIQFSPLPQHVDQEHHDHHHHHNHIEINHRHIEIEQSSFEERFDCHSFMIILRMALIGTLLLGLSLRQGLNDPPKAQGATFPPKIFLNSLHVPYFNVSDGELSSMWDITLAISNVMNFSNINILKLEAVVCYKEHETLAWVTPIEPQYALQTEVFPIGGEEVKEVNLKLNTTGWEKDQPIVDDKVIQDIAEDMQRGVARFSLHLKVMGEVDFGDGWVAAFAMYPRCNDLRVKFGAKNQQGDEVVTPINQKPRECVGLIEWQPIRDSL